MPRPLYHRKKTRVPFEQEAGWAPELVCIFFGKEKYVFAAAGIRTPDCPGRSPVAMSSTLVRFLCVVGNWLESEPRHPLN